MDIFSQSEELSLIFPKTERLPRHFIPRNDNTNCEITAAFLTRHDILFSLFSNMDLINQTPTFKLNPCNTKVGFMNQAPTLENIK